LPASVAALPPLEAEAAFRATKPAAAPPSEPVAPEIPPAQTLAQALSDQGITSGEAQRMNAGQWNKLAEDAGQGAPNEVTIAETLFRLRRLEAAQPGPEIQQPGRSFYTEAGELKSKGLRAEEIKRLNTEKKAQRYTDIFDQAGITSTDVLNATEEQWPQITAKLKEMGLLKGKETPPISSVPFIVRNLQALEAQRGILQKLEGMKPPAAPSAETPVSQAEAQFAAEKQAAPPEAPAGQLPASVAARSVAEAEAAFRQAKAAARKRRTKKPAPEPAAVE